MKQPFSELTGKEKSIELTRWVFVLPAAVLVVFVARIIVSLVRPPRVAQLPGTPVAPASDFERFVLPWIFCIVMGAAFVIAGAKIAPRYRFVTAIALSFLWIIYALNYYVLIHLSNGAPHYTHFVVTTLTAVGGAAYIYYTEKLNRSNRSVHSP